MTHLKGMVESQKSEESEAQRGNEERTHIPPALWEAMCCGARIMELRHAAPRPVHCGCLRLGNCHVTWGDSQKQFALMGGRGLFFTGTAPLPVSMPSIPPPALLGNYSHVHVPHGVPHSQADIWSCHRGGRELRHPSILCGDIHFLWHWGTLLPTCTQWSLPEPAESLTQFGTGCIR